jgi:K+-sensing histidine kinase KdpD
MQHLLHALNQPLTGLQCSLELAASGPRSSEQYRATLREGLELVGRMRVLVEAVREIAAISPPENLETATFSLTHLLQETAAELEPVARENEIKLAIDGDDSLAVRANQRECSTLLFRLLDSALSLAHAGSPLQISISGEADAVCLSVTLREGDRPENSPFSRQELGLLVAQAGWERAGALWTELRSNHTLTCTIRMPRADSSFINEPETGDSK